MIETLILSALSVVLGSIELLKLKGILQYTEEQRRKKKKSVVETESS
jgi:hypothetical protein